MKSWALIVSSLILAVGMIAAAWVQENTGKGKYRFLSGNRIFDTRTGTQLYWETAEGKKGLVIFVPGKILDTSKKP